MTIFIHTTQRVGAPLPQVATIDWYPLTAFYDPVDGRFHLSTPYEVRVGEPLAALPKSLSLEVEHQASGFRIGIKVENCMCLFIVDCA